MNSQRKALNNRYLNNSYSYTRPLIQRRKRSASEQVRLNSDCSRSNSWTPGQAKIVVGSVLSLLILAVATSCHF